ncbi:MAG: chloride channel protein [Myxococcales bacterium]|nr:chloride channel protein [Myxococcales bacterium]
MVEERTARASRLSDKVRRALLRALPSEAQRLFALTLLVGVVCGVVAVAFHLAIHLAEHLLIERAYAAPGLLSDVLVVALPTVGGLVVGACLTWLVPGARGSGIPQVKQAFAEPGGRVRLRDAVGKFFLGAAQIGSGASLGREGPTVQICAGASSALARAARLSPLGAKRLMPVGVAAGIAAAFNAPIAAVTFTIEEIVGKLDQAVLSGVVVAAALAAVIERSVLGTHPVIEVKKPYGLDHPSSLLFYALLGVAAALVSVLFTDALLGVRAAFRRFRRVPPWAHPGLGGLATGLLAVGVLRGLGERGVTGGGYETLGLALAGKLSLAALAVLCFVKMSATVLSYSSGGAGGIFAPSLFVGAMLGGVLGYADMVAFGHDEASLGAFALVGMGAVFAGVVRAPITSVLIIFEMTGDYGLVLPLMVANTASYVLARKARPKSIYEALLAQDGVTLPEAEPGPREPTIVTGVLRVGEAASEAVVVPAHASVTEALSLVASSPALCFPVVRPNGTCLGIVRASVLRAASSGSAGLRVDALVQGAPVLRDDEVLAAGASGLVRSGVGVALIVDADERLTGVLRPEDVLRALAAHGDIH